jgi:site-specific DNA-cytosine methylase
MIHASPPCIEYSRAKTVGVRKIDEANLIVFKTLEIINYFNPRIWLIENPQSGLLKEQEFMKGLPYFDIDYCKYGFNYRKRTRLWTNLDTWTPRPLCKKDCDSMDGNRHKETAQRLPSKTKADWGDNPVFHSQTDLYKIPQLLVEEILNAVNIVCFK